MSDEQFVNNEQRPFENDRKSVKWFSHLMILKLQKNRHKAHWSKATCSYLFSRLKEEVHELEDSFDGNVTAEILSECADVANFAMMIADNYSKEQA